MISIVLPVRNETENLGTLVSGIDHVMTRANHRFEIIAIDDYSTDNSYEILVGLSKAFPLKAYKKQGIIGKGAALVEGIKRAQGDIVVLMDADRTYPPEAIPELIDRLSEADIIVANRVNAADSEHRAKKFLKRTFESFFGRVLFGLDYDVQSGLKVFKKKIMKHVSVEPSKWSFDLEFLLKARHAGYSILGVDVALSHRNSAIQVVSNKQVYVMLGILAATILFFLFNWMEALVFIISFLTLLYFIDLTFNLFLILSSLRKNPELSVTQHEIREITDWPMYTIICPLFKEWEVLPQFIAAIAKLDYPKEKLQVIISLEEVDKKTIEEIGKMKLPSYFEVLVTPDTMPRTKPKACNYALLHTKGDYVVIYDAEDIPDRMQLKKAIAAFKRLEGQNVVCLQAKLNFYNPNQNLLTRLFSLEYSLWFDLVLTGLHSINAPIPLGGTSNHFKKEYLDLLQGWDPFNVTEDCDLGIRLFKHGYHTKVLDSVTMEEANSSFFGWFPQRSRWIKGYIQTYLVHMRRPHEFITDWSNPHILTFQIIVGFKILSMWINPLLWMLTITYFALRPMAGPFIESLYLTPILYLGVISLIAGNFLYFYYYMIGAAKRQQWDLIKYAFFVPGYWLMMSYASLLALRQIIFAPHYWEKTKHGLHLKKTVVAA
ncbi:glycosyltransferase [Candidatus Microgenomates bacterium]|nr:glycosyltransferase [Candidatus Microgenomates bacterium]